MSLCAYVAGIGVLGPGLPDWPAFSGGAGGRVLHLDLGIHTSPEANRARYEFWDADAAPRRQRD